MEAINYRKKIRNAAEGGGVDRYSGLVISVGSSIFQWLAFGIAFYSAWKVKEDWLHPLFWVGLATVVSGMLLRMHCWRVLGEFFTHTVTIADNHRVVDNGAYRWIRHPSYLGALLTLIGLGLALGNYGSIALLVIGSMAVYIYRIETEEAALESALGDSYTQFKKTRKRLIPFVY
ncbi:MAG: isoprenylcysteine carboxylmethyltransferase family protein [Burkholderiales bacterium]|nr:isoprenylcysteine carboxylmethyltransferase family protein [Burkholderiales bacterium]